MAFAIRQFKFSNLKKIVIPRSFDPLHRVIGAFSSQVLRENGNETIRPGNQNRTRDVSYRDAVQSVNHTGVIYLNNLNKLMNDIKEAGTATSAQSIFLLQSCGQPCVTESDADKNNLVNRIWTMYEALDIPLDVSHYNALLQAYNDNEYQFSPTEFLEALEKKNIKPNRITYSRLIARYCQEGNIDGTNTILEKMKEESMAINTPIFNTLILGNARAKDLDGVQAIVNLMLKSDMEIGVHTQGALFKAYAELNEVEKAKSVLQEVQASDSHLPCNDFMHAMISFGKNDNSEVVAEFLETFQKHTGYGTAAMSAMRKLLEAGKVESAYLFAESLGNNRINNLRAKFFPATLALSNTPQTTAAYCKKLFDSGKNLFAFENALEAYLRQGDPSKVLAFFKEMKNNNIELRDHYMNPFFVSLKKQNIDLETALPMIQEAISAVGECKNETLKNYVFPVFEPIEDPGKMFTQLNGLNIIPVNRLYCALIEHLMYTHGLEEAVQLIDQFGLPLSRHVVSRLAQPYLRDQQPVLAAKIVNSFWQQKDGEDSSNSAFVGIHQLLRYLMDKDAVDSHIVPLFKEFGNLGGGFTNSEAIHIENILGKNMTPALTDALSTIRGVSMVSKPKRYSPAMKKMIEDKLDEVLASENPMDGTLLNQALTVALQDEDSQVFIDLVAKLKGKGVLIPGNINVSLAGRYITENNTAKVQEIFSEIVENDPSYQIHPNRILDLAQLLLVNNQFDDTIKALLMYAPTDGAWDSKFNMGSTRTSIPRLIATIAQSVDLESMKLLQDTLKSRDYAPPKTLQSMLVKYHCCRGELSEALKCFTEIHAEHGTVEFKDDLIQAAIREENTEVMQQVIDILTTTFGETNALYEIAFAFIECDKPKQAAKVFQTPGIRAIQSRLEWRVNYWIEDGKLEWAEELINSTKDIFNIEREPLYLLLLKAYVQHDQTDKALATWTQLQEEGAAASNTFLRTLGLHIQRKGFEPPFKVPDAEIFSPARVNPVKERNTEADLGRSVKNVRSKKLTFVEVDTVAQMVQNRDLDQVASTVRGRLHVSIGQVFDKLCEREDFESIKVFWSTLYQNDVQSVFLFNKVSNLFTNSGKHEELMDTLIKLTDSYSGNFFMSPLLFQKLLQEKPELESQVFALAEALSQHDDKSGYSLLVDYKYSTGQTEEATKLYQEHVQNKHYLNTAMSINVFKDQKDLSFLDGLSKMISEDVTQKLPTIKLHTARVRRLVDTEEYEKAIEMIENNLPHIPLEEYDTKALTNIKKSVEAANKIFPFTIPRNRPSHTTDSSSSSDSD